MKRGERYRVSRNSSCCNTRKDRNNIEARAIELIISSITILCLIKFVKYRDLLNLPYILIIEEALNLSYTSFFAIYFCFLNFLH